MKRNIPLLVFFCLIFSFKAHAQTTNITGTVYDDVTKEAIEMASIRVLNATDSAYVAGSATDAKGKFNINVKRGTYIVQVSFMSYISQYFKVNARNGIAVLGDVYLKEDAVLLNEAIVEAKAPEIIVKGDTVEYNADAYKVQETAVLADLIKKIPGAEIDADGKITVNGKDISKILVDGKEFFSNDPKIASENLPAKMIEKLQVLDQKSDMARLTGFDDGEEQTVINLIARPGMKEGIMGTVGGGYGSEDRYEANGFLNVAKNNNRFSALGNFNNNNNAGGGGGGRWGGNRGVTETTMGGINIAMEPSKKLKYDGDIQYNGRDNNVETTSNTEYTDGSISEKKSSVQNTNNQNFNTRLRFEWTPDSLTNIIFRPDFSYSRSTSAGFNDGERTSTKRPDYDFVSNGHSSSKGNTFRLNGNLLINRKLNDKGRSFSLEFSGGLSDGKTEGDSYSENDYYKIDSLYVQDQIYTQKNNSYNWRARVSYLEPVGYNNFLELAYDIRNTHSETDKVTYDNDGSDNYTVLAEDYTRNTKNDFLNQRISASFQSRRAKYNYTAGLELMPSRSRTSVVKPKEGESRDQAKNYLNFAPRLEFNYLWDRRHNLRIRYNGQTSQASTDQLFDGIISQNATDTTWGNPDLKPSFSHRLELRYRKYIPEKASSIMAFLNFNYVMDDIVSVTRAGVGNSMNTTYENMDGNMNGRAMFMYNTPLKNKSFSINSRTFVNYNRDNTYIYEENEKETYKNTANVYSINENLGLKYNSDKFQFDIGGNFSFEENINSYQKRNDKTIYNYGGMGSFTWYLPYSFVLASNLTYSSNSGYEAGYQQNSWIWNAELAKEFNITLKSGESKTSLPATVKFRIYDILKDQSNISRSANAQRVTYSTYNTISSYFMVGLTIRFQSFKGMKSTDMEGPRMRGMGGGRRHM
ncbi:hypothetical protein M2451_000532 [Dysgonomonas sp. PFB1-18]|uniref:TonB-dependent receptor n=1 Tax=unclassified Dysgonomonas TaxID=2630389 RepID=UPI0024759783|nr:MULTISPECIES: TonB-dependent receptor [unclassified Dysgonomonas]MDH6307383.1 hypothetical protein [Dysgonomonas sp. PF1-14]MDH6337301.1 hypothetical protein [Dysgonomonas sp. PF1-16]MDH6379225.1 hypothetical protein [Dysgonomonas sp. PFB1-18]MDH6396137.1 hypothetical protein [Dysgonomonas sp. PF1-23]